MQKTKQNKTKQNNKRIRKLYNSTFKQDIAIKRDDYTT